MSSNRWLSRVREFKFGRGDTGKMEYLFAGALALIIIAALALTINQLFFGGGRGGLPDELHFYCLNPKCHAEVTIPTKDLNIDELDNTRQTCPKCGKKSLEVMQQCPLCKQFFVPPKNVQGDTICPKCNGNITDYYRKKAKELG